MPRQRNYVAQSPLMRKGGPHIKSKTGQRVRQRLRLEDSLDEWYENNQNNAEEDKNGEQEAPHDALTMRFKVCTYTILSVVA